MRSESIRTKSPRKETGPRLTMKDATNRERRNQRLRFPFYVFVFLSTVAASAQENVSDRHRSPVDVVLSPTGDCWSPPTRHQIRSRWLMLGPLEYCMRFPSGDTPRTSVSLLMVQRSSSVPPGLGQLRSSKLMQTKGNSSCRGPSVLVMSRWELH